MCIKTKCYAGRQIFVLTAVFLSTFSLGIMVSFPAVLNPSILSPNSTISVSADQASWIAASNGFSGILGFFIISPLFQIIGRKYVNLGVNIIQLIGWAIFVAANSLFGLLSARMIQGIAIGSYYIKAITISEYSDPKRRGYFMSMTKISQAFGSLACHSLAFVYDWRQIAAFSAAPVILSSMIIIFWPESSSFLAMKGRFNECEKSFTWLFGNSEKKQKELKALINAQVRRLEEKKQSPRKLFFVTKLVKKFLRKDFLKPFMIVSLLTIAVDACGRYFLLAYLTQIMTEITEDQSIAMYCSVASDILLIVALSVSCLVIKLYKRRTLLFFIGTFANILMFIVSLVLILKSHFNIATNVRWLVPSIILLHSFVAHVGLIPTAFTISAEIFPLEHKGFGSFASGIVFTSFYALFMKFTPTMIESTGVAGTYAIFGLCLTVCLVLLYIILPETKDKTLQQIEDEIKGVRRSLKSNLLVTELREIQVLTK